MQTQIELPFTRAQLVALRACCPSKVDNDKQLQLSQAFTSHEIASQIEKPHGQGPWAKDFAARMLFEARNSRLGLSGHVVGEAHENDRSWSGCWELGCAISAGGHESTICAMVRQFSVQ